MPERFDQACVLLIVDPYGPVDTRVCASEEDAAREARRLLDMKHFAQQNVKYWVQPLNNLRKIDV